MKPSARVDRPTVAAGPDRDRPAVAARYPGTPAIVDGSEAIVTRAAPAAVTALVPAGRTELMLVEALR
jgi:hypothetical protein